MTFLWWRGTIVHRAGRLAATAAGVATGVAVLASLGRFLAAVDASPTATYCQVLFVFLTLPAAALTAWLTAVIAAAGAPRRRRDQALLRTRGASRAAMLRLAAIEAGTVGAAGSLAGLGAASWVGHATTGSTSVGTTTGAGVPWGVGALVVGLGIAFVTGVQPVHRDLREGSTVAGGDRRVRARRPWWMRGGLDLALVATSVAAFYATRGTHSSSALATPAGPTVSPGFWAFLAPALLWIGSGLLAWRAADAVLSRRGIVSRGIRPLAGNLSDTVAATMSRERRLLVRAIVLMALAVAFAASTATVNASIGVRLGGSSMTSIDLAGLPRLERGVGLGLVASAGGLVLALSREGRRRSLAIAAALGADRRQVLGFIASEAAVVTLAGLTGGALAGWGLARMLVATLPHRMDSPSAHLVVPWTYLTWVLLIAVAAMASASIVATRRGLEPPMGSLRELG